MTELSVLVVLALLLTGFLSLSSAQTVTVTGTNATAGSNQVVTCAVDPAEPGVTYIFEWHRAALVVQQASTESTYKLRVQLTDAGDEYQCVVHRSDNSVFGSEDWTLRVTIPDFDWRVTWSSLSFYVGLNFSITFTSLLENVGSVAAEVTIWGPSGVIAWGKEGDRVRTFYLETNDGNFEKIVQFSPLSVVDRGIYTCTGTVMPSEFNAFITNGRGQRSADIFSISIPVPVISLGVAIPPPSPQRLLDIPPFNFLTLSCSAEITVRANRVPFSMTFSWQRSVSPSAPREDLPSNSFTNEVIFGSMATSVLSINTTLSGNHIYVCCVTLDVIPAPDNITADSTQPITVYGQANPAPPVNLTASIVRHNHVTVEWQVSLLTYDPETYHVMYGTKQSNISMESAAVSGTRVELEDLMVNTRYYYCIVAMNSVGASSSETSSFATTLTYDDKCSENLNFCHINATCFESLGSLMCTCNEGFTGDGFLCEDIVECLDPSFCSDLANCTNLVGSFSCVCPTGYSGNGTHCFVPPLAVVVFLRGLPINSNFFTGLQLNLTCIINISPMELDIPTSLSVSAEWSKSGTSLTTSSRVTVDEEPLLVEPLQYQTSLLFNSLDKTRDEGNYTCAVHIIHNLVGIFDSAASLYITVQTLFFQLKFTGVSNCERWRSMDIVSKDMDIVKAIVKSIAAMCDCDFTADRLTDRVFLCLPSSPQSITYQVQLHGTLQAPVADLGIKIQEWAFSGVSIPVQFVPIKLEGACISSTTSTLECELTESTQMEDKNAVQFGTIIAAVMAIVVVFVLIIIALAIIINVRIRSSKMKPKTESERVGAIPLSYVGTSTDNNSKYEDILNYQCQDHPSTDIKTATCPAYMPTVHQNQHPTDADAYEEL